MGGEWASGSGNSSVQAASNLTDVSGEADTVVAIGRHLSQPVEGARGRGLPVASAAAPAKSVPV